MIQIPCLNEAENLPATLGDLPRSVEGFDEVEWLIIDDGSRDRTGEVAATHGADHVVRFSTNRGLAAAFSAGLQEAVRRGADVVVNTDADNQYCADDIVKLTAPVLRREADIVVGDRQVKSLRSFSGTKRWLQVWGSTAVRRLSGTQVRDAPSGFRAFSRFAAVRLNVFTSYTYTLETLIQAGQLGLKVVSVPVRVNPSRRRSRLMRNNAHYVLMSVLTMGRVVLIYRPLRILLGFGGVLLLAATALGLRFLWYYVTGEGSGKVQSLILASILAAIGFQTCVLGVLADLISVNRRLLDRLRVELAPAASGDASVRGLGSSEPTERRGSAVELEAAALEPADR
ncbi:MAG: glycosyltransferase family 2 protein [Planctomycetota bacterium]